MLLKYFIILFVYAFAFAAARNLWNPHVEQNSRTAAQKNHCEFENILKGMKRCFRVLGGEKIFCCYCQCSFWGQYFSHLNGRTNGGRRESAGVFFVCWRTHTNFMRITFYCAILCFSLSLSLALTRSLSLLCWSSSFCCCVFFACCCLCLYIHETWRCKYRLVIPKFPFFSALYSLLLWPTIEIQQAKGSIVFLLVLLLSIVMFSCLSCLLRSLGGSQEEKKAKKGSAADGLAQDRQDEHRGWGRKSFQASLCMILYENEKEKTRDDLGQRKGDEERSESTLVKLFQPLRVDFG